jgi:hypothetical protein
MAILREVRPANIPDADRDLFERYGEQVIGMVLAGGFSPSAADLQRLYTEAAIKAHARDWLTERADTLERREQRLEILEWAIVALIVLELIVGAIQLTRDNPTRQPAPVSSSATLAR